jgi:uncharacterized phage protein gp47/JayE
VYNAREQEDILAELQENSTTAASKIEGTFEYDVFASNSLEFAKVEVELEQAYKAAFGSTAWGEYLTMRAAEAGVIRKEAVKAIGEVTVTGTGTVVAGTIFATIDGTQFQTTQEVTVANSGTVPIEAVVAGEGGNVAEDTITVIPMSIAGISAVTNEAATYNGYDEEDDDTLRDRYLTHVRYPGTSGNPRHYIEWATSIPGVGAARCIRAWNGADTVKVIIVDSNYEAASDELVQTVYDYIESVRPINAILTVVSATPLIVNISANTTGSIDTEAFRASVKEYFAQLEKKSLTSDSSRYVSIAKIGALILDAGADDYSALTLNGGTANVTFTENELPAIGAVVFNG